MSDTDMDVDGFLNRCQERLDATMHHSDERMLIAAKTCDRCGHDAVQISMPRERKSPQSGDSCKCCDCELPGTVIFHGGAPETGDIEDQFDVAFYDPDSGEQYEV